MGIGDGVVSHRSFGRRSFSSVESSRSRTSVRESDLAEQLKQQQQQYQQLSRQVTLMQGMLMQMGMQMGFQMGPSAAQMGSRNSVPTQSGQSTDANESQASDAGQVNPQMGSGVEVMQKPPPARGSGCGSLSGASRTTRRWRWSGKAATVIVIKARHRGTGETVAVKGAKRAPSASAVVREASCLAACRGHPSVVEIRDVVADAATGALFLVTEFVGPSLHRILSGTDSGMARPRRFAEREARAVMQQLLRGAERMHGAGIVHRNIKPENILVAPGGAVKICDLGMAAPVTTSPPGSTPYREPRVGTLRYRAPEQLAGCRCYGPAVDMWALGCVMAELLTGKLLFDAKTRRTYAPWR